jgi:hypothetical protein
VWAYIRSFYPLSRRGTGKLVSEALATEIRANPNNVIAVVADNTGNMRTAFTQLDLLWPWIFYIGCCVHILDIIMEDMCALDEIKKIVDRVHFLVSFVKKHAVLREEFMRLQAHHNVTVELKLFPTTRFTYASLMCYNAYANFVIFNMLADSAIFKESRETQKKKGADGKKSLQEHDRFVRLSNDGAFKLQVVAVHDLLQPFSTVLHASEKGNMSPGSVYVLYQTLFDFVQIDNLPESVTSTFSEETLNRVRGIVKMRWKGEGQKIGLRCDILLCTFRLDPFLRSAVAPELDSMDVSSAVNRCFKVLSRGDQDMVTMLTGQQNLYKGRGNDLLTTHLDAVDEMVRSIKVKAYAKLRLDKPERANHEVYKLVAVLEMLPKPITFWRPVMSETLPGWTQQDALDWKRFCQMCIDMCSIVVHSCGTERHGKGYKLVHTAARSRIGEHTLNMLLYIYFNFTIVMQVDRQAKDSGTAPSSASSLQYPAPDLEGFVLDMLPEADAEQLKV